MNQVTLDGGVHQWSGSGNDDWLTLSDDGHSVVVDGVETLLGGTAADWITLADSGSSVILTRIETLLGGTGQDWINLGDRGNTTILTEIETLVGGTGQDWISLGNRGNTLILAAIETLSGGTGQDDVSLGNRGNTITVGGIETVTGGTGADWVTLSDALGSTVFVSGLETLIGTSGGEHIDLDGDGCTMVIVNIDTIHGTSAVENLTAYGSTWFEGHANADVAVLQAGAGTDTIVFASSMDGGAAGSATGHDDIYNFQSGTDHIEIIGGLKSALDENGDTILTVASRTTGTVDAATDEAVVLATTVSSLTETGFAGVRTALGSLTNSSVRADVAILASDGSNTGLYMVNDSDGNGTIAATEITLMALFYGSVMTTGDITLGG